MIRHHVSKACPNSFSEAANYRNLVTGKQTIAAITATTLDKPINAEDVMLVAAVSYAVSSSVLGSGDESWFFDSEYVPSPTSVPHILWHAHLHTPSGLSNVMPMLIDFGSTIVLIHEDVATSLNLRHCKICFIIKELLERTSGLPLCVVNYEFPLPTLLDPSPSPQS